MMETKILGGYRIKPARRSGRARDREKALMARVQLGSTESALPLGTLS
jgi:hypothetical protein